MMPKKQVYFNLFMLPYGYRIKNNTLAVNTAKASFCSVQSIRSSVLYPLA